MLMSKEEIALTINHMKTTNDNNLRDGYDRVGRMYIADAIRVARGDYDK